ncbi:DUF350 domain-containing protein [Pedobacter sp. SYSU D00535]|uniref:DUF350 domain-containing protein n=1 Tax=Pedobacter sp. SYSU D00535 TaxID=2810308 RepID=UPI001F609183|nr:DUF350 domain-containing protein [Pedobacter sp. SYSU D00535]
MATAVILARERAFIINNISMSLQELINYKYIVASIVYSGLGILILLIAFWIIEKITPENLWKEIIDKHNIALAIVCAAFMIAVAIIISSAIHG